MGKKKLGSSDSGQTENELEVRGTKSGNSVILC